MLGDLFDSPWKLLIIAVVLIILFGGKKMPDAARSLGRSMRILKAEVKDLHGDHDHDTAQTPQQAPAMQPAQGQQISQMQQQLGDLQQLEPAGQTVTAGGGAPADPARTQQTG